MNEKREFLRFQVSFPFKFVQGEDSPEAKATVKNLSMSGLKVALNKSLSSKLAGLTNFHLVLSGDNVLKISGEVVWQKEYLDRKEVGIRFVHISDSHKEGIYDYIFKYHRQELTQEWLQM
ncbi:MAG: PilZ domain-containing protein [Candidatus Omnitrophica bacterium]|nr:PilZ domain-containing protein [Candidatus Omnitrophota bacterium]